jgi:hypothetical protein
MQQTGQIRLAVFFLLLGTAALGVPVRSQTPPSEVPSSEVPAAAQSDPEQMRTWHRELHDIADLLIDDKPAEAGQRAAKLLLEAQLPEEVAARARELSAKAEEKLERVVQAPRADEAPEKDKKKKNPPAAPAAVSFRVRLGEAGKGFAEGAAGQLLISSAGLTFTREGSARADWSILWQALTDARRDSGLWDVPFVLAMTERGEQIRYLARVDGGGRYLPGDPILAAIDKERRRIRETREAAEIRSSGKEIQ